MQQCYKLVDVLTICMRSPEAMMQEVWRRPSATALADLKECLDFGASTWIALFARLGGADLLLQVHPHTALFGPPAAFVMYTSGDGEGGN